MRKLITAFVSLLILTFSLSAQSYIRLDSIELSGINTDEFQDSLEMAADSLIAAFPVEYQDSFKVYDFGFYLHNEVFEGEFPKVFENVIARVENLSTYYLLFGKATTKEGIYSKYYLYLKLPTSDVFSCYESYDIDILISSIKDTINDIINVSSDKIYNFVQSEISGINLLKQFITKQVSCCDPGRGLRSECELCPKVEELRIHLESNGFLPLEVENLQYNTLDSTIGVLDINADISIEVNDTTLNLTADVGNFLNQLANKIEGVEGTINYYDPYSASCLNVLNIISNNTGDIFSLNSISITTRTTTPDFSYRLCIIVTEGQDGSKFVHTKVIAPENPHPSGKIIYLQRMDNSNLDMDSIKLDVINYYTILGTYSVPQPYPSPSIEVDLVPTIDTIDFLHLEDFYDNVVVLFGKPSTLVEFTQNYYFSVSGDWANTSDKSSGVCRFINPAYYDRLLEMGSKHICLVRDDISQEIIELFKCQEIEDLCAFLAFHATGHSADANHYSVIITVAGPLLNHHQSYMSSGCCIITHYLGEFTPCTVCGPGTEVYDSLEEMVIETRDNVAVTTIKEKLYERFIK